MSHILNICFDSIFSVLEILNCHTYIGVYKTRHLFIKPYTHYMVHSAGLEWIKIKYVHSEVHQAHDISQHEHFTENWCVTQKYCTLLCIGEFRRTATFSPSTPQVAHWQVLVAQVKQTRRSIWQTLVGFKHAPPGYVTYICQYFKLFVSFFAGFITSTVTDGTCRHHPGNLS